jgi:glutamate formiminotransferase
MKLVECVPNFSEGKRGNIIKDIIGELDGYKVKILDKTPDPDHNRTDVTFIGEPDEVKRAAMSMALKAVELIDMTKHRGEHPRMGAIDVVPFIPLMDSTMEECVKIAKSFAEGFSQKTDVPCFLYEEAASRPERKNLANVRKGEFEGLRDEIGSNPDKTPDYGPNHIHPTAGATAVGARFFLVAFNVNLGTDNINIAQTIAKAVRHSSGGFRYVKAMGFDIKKRGIVQVSMNLVNYRGTPLFRVFEAIKSEARRYGINVLGSELIGLVPLEAMLDAVDFYLQLEDFNYGQVLEQQLLEALQ